MPLQAPDGILDGAQRILRYPQEKPSSLGRRDAWKGRFERGYNFGILALELLFLRNHIVTSKCTAIAFRQSSGGALLLTNGLLQFWCFVFHCPMRLPCWVRHVDGISNYPRYRNFQLFGDDRDALQLIALQPSFPSNFVAGITHGVGFSY
jgi:hypothetical protein